MKYALLLGILAATGPALPAVSWIWIEGEQPAQTNITPHPWYHGQVKKNLLSNGDFLAHFSESGPGYATYEFHVSQSGTYNLWLRLNPLGRPISYRLDDGDEQRLTESSPAADQTNIAADNKPDLRFIAWSSAGTLELVTGIHRLTFTFAGQAGPHYHGSLDCFLLTPESFTPQGISKPDQVANRLQAIMQENPGWSIWNPPTDPFAESPIDLRFLNEKTAGQNGYVRVENGQFLLGNGQPVRFWAVNGPPKNLRGPALRRCARMLAKYGVNLVRVHSTVFDRQTGAWQPETAEHFQEIVSAMKAEGIYTLFSIYFPLWMTPQPGLPFLQGYDGSKHPFAALMFNPDFQKVYQDWWKNILTARPVHGDLPLLQEPAVMGLEIQNEDSFFFWTFNDNNLPDPQRHLLQKNFAEWVIKKYGRLSQAFQSWNGLAAPGDDAAAGRLGFRPLYELFTHRTPRDRDTARFLMETQRRFYEKQITFLRGLGYRGLITASNWTTANNDILGPLEKYSYTAGDFMDRHGYWAGLHQGEHAAWSIREGHVFSHRSALRFDPPEPGKPRVITHPVFDTRINGLPSMISETTFNRPNRYRTEAPLFYAAYGSLQDSNGIVHFALDGSNWQVKPNFFMQPWTLISPTQFGQFPAAALIFRQSLIQPGSRMAVFHLSLEDALALKGSPLVQSANLDELRKSDLFTAESTSAPSSGTIDPIIHLIGQTSLTIGPPGGENFVGDLKPFLDTSASTIRSSTGELLLNHDQGWLRFNAARVQGAVGNLAKAGPQDLPMLRIESPLDLAAIVLVSLDGQPLATSKKMLLQVMTEEKPLDFRAEETAPGIWRITNIGTDPWLFRSPAGTITLKHADSSRLVIQPLDTNGYASGSPLSGPKLELLPSTAYYLIEAPLP